MFQKKQKKSEARLKAPDFHLFFRLSTLNNWATFASAKVLKKFRFSTFGVDLVQNVCNDFTLLVNSLRYV
nr:MAG TPA: hypothetical protein [Caudoviricetes sp.]